MRYAVLVGMASLLALGGFRGEARADTPLKLGMVLQTDVKKQKGGTKFTIPGLQPGDEVRVQVVKAVPGAKMKFKVVIFPPGKWKGKLAQSAQSPKDAVDFSFKASGGAGDYNMQLIIAGPGSGAKILVQKK